MNSSIKLCTMCAHEISQTRYLPLKKQVPFWNQIVQNGHISCFHVVRNILKRMERLHLINVNQMCSNNECIEYYNIKQTSKIK